MSSRAVVHLTCDSATARSSETDVLAKMSVGEPPDLIALAKAEHLSPIEACDSQALSFERAPRLPSRDAMLLRAALRQWSIFVLAPLTQCFSALAP
eukprot:4197197-Pleurochrysis_carterae.AAC.3